MISFNVHAHDYSTFLPFCQEYGIVFIMKSRQKKIYHFPVIIEKDEQGYYIGKVPSLKSCYTQAKTLPELYKRLQEVVELCLEVEQKLFKEKVSQNEFVGVHQFEFRA